MRGCNIISISRHLPLYPDTKQPYIVVIDYDDVIMICFCQSYNVLYLLVWTYVKVQALTLFHYLEHIIRSTYFGSIRLKYI